MAVGATPRDLLKLVLGGGLKMAVAGIGIGLIMVLASLHLLATTVLPVSVPSVPPFLLSALLIGAFTLLACWFPAWRATTLSPMVAIHSDVHSNWNRVRFNYRVLTERISDLVLHEREAPTARNDILASIADAPARRILCGSDKGRLNDTAR